MVLNKGNTVLNIESGSHAYGLWLLIWPKNILIALLCYRLLTLKIKKKVGYKYNAH